jgi:DNA (cytosine-5)-methyltransferase 1
VRRLEHPELVKPPYRVPTMAEVRAVEPNGLVAASTFSGCGGSSLGYRMAGFRVAWASEFVQAARDTYRANFPDAIVDERDVRLVQAGEVLEALRMRPGELDLLDGSPPCASFSTAGNREKDWGAVKAYSATKQRTDDLFFEYARLLAGIQPRAFVAENVSGLVKGTAKGYFKEILRALEGAGPGYVVRARLLDAQWLGVPQARQRVIFVGMRKDLGVEPEHPAPLSYRYSLREALPWIGPTARVVHDTSGAFGAGDVTDRPSPAITVGAHSVNSLHFKVFAPLPPTEEELQGTSFEGYALEAEWRRLQPGEGSDKYLNLRRAHPDEPCPTVTATGGSNPGTAGVAHPSEPRKFTIPELRRVCSFPHDFVLTGSYAEQWERCGRAVPPLMMRAVARAVAGVLLGARR